MPIILDAQWTNKAVEECQGVEWILDCNPPCPYKLESFDNGTRCCLMNYSTGNVFNITRSCVYAVISSETTGKFSLKLKQDRNNELTKCRICT